MRADDYSDALAVVRWGHELKLRAELESLYAKRVQCPIVCLAVQGGAGTAGMIYESAKKMTPSVIVAQSGGGWLPQARTQSVACTFTDCVRTFTLAASNELSEYFKLAQKEGYIGKGDMTDKKEVADEQTLELPEALHFKEINESETANRTLDPDKKSNYFEEILKMHKKSGELLITFYDMCACSQLETPVA